MQISNIALCSVSQRPPQTSRSKRKGHAQYCPSHSLTRPSISAHFCRMSALQLVTTIFGYSDIRVGGSSSSTTMLATCCQPFLVIFSFILGLFPGVHRFDVDPHMRFVTYNLRYDSQPDGISVAQSIAQIPDQLEEQPYLELRGEQPWSKRRLLVAQQVLSEGIVLAGYQEALVR